MSNVPPPPSPPGEPVPGQTPVPPPPPPGLQPPPGYVAYGAAPTPTARVSRIGGLTKAITVLVAIASAATALGAILSVSATDAAHDLLDGRTSTSDFQDATIGYNLVQLGTGLVTLSAMVVVIIWMYRIAANIRAFGISTTWHPIWAVFGWVLPPVLYVIPLLMLRELWKKSAHSAGSDQSGGGENMILLGWFALFSLIPAVLTVISLGSFADQFASQGAEQQAELLVDAGSFTIINAIVTVGAGIAWILFVRQLSTRHTAMTGER